MNPELIRNVVDVVTKITEGFTKRFSWASIDMTVAQAQSFIAATAPIEREMTDERVQAIVNCPPYAGYSNACEFYYRTLCRKYSRHRSPDVTEIDTAQKKIDDLLMAVFFLNHLWDGSCCTGGTPDCMYHIAQAAKRIKEG